MNCLLHQIVNCQLDNLPSILIQSLIHRVFSDPASAVTRIVASDVDLERSLSINGTEINLYPTMDLADAIATINAASSTTNVRAEWFSETGIVLTNMSGFEGDNIVLGAPAVLDQVSALGLVPALTRVHMNESKQL